MDREALRRKLKGLHLSPSNLKMVDYWLSLSVDGALPLRKAFDPAAASEVLPGCALFEVHPGKSVRIRIAGMVFRLVFGPNIAGQDWLAVTPARHRRQRLVRYSAVAQGAIGVGRRRVVSEGRQPVHIEEMMFPFADVAEDGARSVLVHTDWRPEGDEWFGVDPTFAETLADEFELVALD